MLMLVADLLAAEPISHEPWLAVLLAVISAISGITAAVLGYKAATHARSVSRSVGVANGNGNLITQVLALSLQLSDHITAADKEFAAIRTQLADCADPPTANETTDNLG